MFLLIESCDTYIHVLHGKMCEITHLYEEGGGDKCREGLDGPAGAKDGQEHRRHSVEGGSRGITSKQNTHTHTQHNNTTSFNIYIHIQRKTFALRTALQPLSKSY